ncbi:hypothetical protein RZO55_25530 [Clostridium boliviensis]|uniref:Uncharacterized protein n=1 Tax=Clostridium boliviensis TaxID=318465 RepID=A0ABU4GVA9_9CLOT|nr:hypothetical protein [Clostridium boliviensis]MDW2800932.1 hypothetical protein [Clostridium boliviensis]
MRKLPALVLAAATVLTVAGVPMTAQAATCSRSLPNCYSSSDCYNSYCYGQSLNSLLSQYGCSNGNSSNCSNSGQKGATYNSRSNCNFGQFSSFRSCR